MAGVYPETIGLLEKWLAVSPPPSTRQFHRIILQAQLLRPAALFSQKKATFERSHQYRPPLHRGSISAGDPRRPSTHDANPVGHAASALQIGRPHDLDQQARRPAQVAHHF